MKKTSLAIITLLALAGCAQQESLVQEVYQGEILLSAYEGKQLKLTIKKNNCGKGDEGSTEMLSVTTDYDSDLPVGACVRVSKTADSISLKNISRSQSRSWIARLPEAEQQ